MDLVLGLWFFKVALCLKCFQGISLFSNVFFSHLGGCFLSFSSGSKSSLRVMDRIVCCCTFA